MCEMCVCVCVCECEKDVCEMCIVAQWECFVLVCVCESCVCVFVSYVYVCKI